ncbi:MAG: BMP family ABC transporter substrate-binding protein [Parasporobacterium sp.]|nr:BMP family ABC transporter substrate-binding protein [Parasporobacterium sp.]
MKKIVALLVVLVMTVGILAACGGSNGGDTPAPAGDVQTDAANQGGSAANTLKVGMVCIGDEQAAYDRNFYMAADAAKEILAKEEINVEWMYTYNHPEGDDVATDCIELAEAGCQVVFLNSYGQEPAMLTVAADYPGTVFAALTNEASQRDELANTVNAFPSIFEGRYLAGVAAGCKLNQLIEEGTITADQAVMGYVGAYTFAEVISGYTSFFLGAKSVCPSVTMKVEFIGSWGDPALEAQAAQDLIDKGAVLISQHSDSTTPATVANENGKFHVGYNISMIDVAPEASIISSRIDWTNYFVYMIECVAKGEPVPEDYFGQGLASGDVVLTELNEAVAAPGTMDKINEVKDQIINEDIHVFDTTTFTVGGAEAKEGFVDMDGDFVGEPDVNAIYSGYYHESFFKSAPNFDLRIDGIELINEAY